MPDPAVKPDPYALWRSPNYLLFSGSWFLITFSRRVEFIALGVYMARWFSAQEASYALGLVGLVQAVPVLLLAIPGGHLADRFNRHRVMEISYSLGIVTSTGMLTTALLGGNIAWFYVFLSLGAVGWALGGPARQAILPHLIPTELFPIGVAWNSSVFYVASVTGPIIGGVLMNLFADMGPLESMAPAFAVVVLCRIAAVGAISLIRYRQPEHAEETVSWQSVVAGIRFVWRTKLILATITLDLFAVLLGGATYLLPIFAEKILHVGSLGLGVLQAADAVGAVCMAVMLAHRPPLRRAGVALLWAVAGFGAATIVFGLSQWFWLSLAMMFLVGALDNISVVVRHTLVQMLTPDAMRGRVSAVNGVFITASNELGGMESGFVAGLFGPVISVVGGGIGTILVVLASMALWPQLLKIGSLGSIRPVEDTDEERA